MTFSLRAVLIFIMGMMFVPSPSGVVAQGDPSSTIVVTVRNCEGRSVLPVFVESHCPIDANAQVELHTPNGDHAGTFSSGFEAPVDDSVFGGSNLFDLRTAASDEGTHVVTCIGREPGTEWHFRTVPVIHADDPGHVLIDWPQSSTGNNLSITCTWLQLPDIDDDLAVLSLQVFETSQPYMNWVSGYGELDDMERGASGDNIEAPLETTNVNTGEEYSFAADGEGQVLVPDGLYEISDTRHGMITWVDLPVQTTSLVEIGIGAAGASPIQEAPDIQTSSVSTVLCALGQSTCGPLPAVQISYESLDGEVQGTCVTETMTTPNGEGSWCEYEYVVGVPTRLTIDESTIPQYTVIEGGNPLYYLQPLFPEGPANASFLIQEINTSMPAASTFYVETEVCADNVCQPLPGVAVEWQSEDGSLTGACVTEVEPTPNGEWAVCGYQHVPGIATTFTVDTSTLPGDYTLISDNPLTFTYPENPDGIVSAPRFQFEGACTDCVEESDGGSQAPETFFVETEVCAGTTCEPLPGISVHWESADAEFYGTCVTQTEPGAGGADWSVCNYQHRPGVATTFFVDETTVPAGFALVSENPLTFTFPENADGIVSQPRFVFEETNMDEGEVGEPFVPETSTFYVETEVCTEAECSPLAGITINWESEDGSLSGSCETAEESTPNGMWAICAYEHIPGVATIFTLDVASAPGEYLLISDNPLTFTYPENPDGIVSAPRFVFEPVCAACD